ncbi:aspartyl/asparaginyl beta-hydroxylase [Patella vulgata]|uniref:aspartyl/asparaginyl beta-hydroxylase n=1 Tax=Patella vulgata TaxID=6465 RepID=UPI0024A88E6E|nr:aspartyl/asparaginyl beta-hydroxylase [Patella vulgata]
MNSEAGLRLFFTVLVDCPDDLADVGVCFVAWQPIFSVDVINKYSNFQSSLDDTINHPQTANQNTENIPISQSDRDTASQSDHDTASQSGQATTSQSDQDTANQSGQDTASQSGQDTTSQSDVSQNEESKSKKVKVEEYDKSEITNKLDDKIRVELDAADDLYDKKNYLNSKALYDEILLKYPYSPRALYGKANCLSKMAEIERSNQLLEKSIGVFNILVTAGDVPDQLLLTAGPELAKLQTFRGWNVRAIKTHQILADRFPKNISLKNQLGVSLLIAGQNTQAKIVFQQVLDLDKDNGFGNVHLGFIYKVENKDLEKAVKYLRAGLNSNAPDTVEGKFYFHLGDALVRLNRPDEARQVYIEGAQKGVLLSPDQRSLYNVNHLTGRPWWTVKQTGYSKYVKLLEDNWKIIRDEGLANMDVEKGVFLPESENLIETGDWKQFTLYARGRQDKRNCQRAPKTCSILQQIPDAIECSRGQVKFSVMHPGVHVWPHTGPTNCRLRAHLGLVIPPGPKIRVANNTRTWTEGEVIIFDDSFEHEVWHHGDSLRLVLIVDFWHPELSTKLRKQLTAI